MQTPGSTASHGPSRNSGWALDSITPSDGVGGRMPRPRNDSTASPMIAAGAATVACTISVFTALGRMCRPQQHEVAGAVGDRAATKSSPRSRSVSPRVTRTIAGTPAMPIAMVAVQQRRPEDRGQPDREHQERERQQGVREPGHTGSRTR